MGPVGVTVSNPPLGGIDTGGLQPTAQRGQPNGYAALDGSGKVPATQLPAALSLVAPGPRLAGLGDSILAHGDNATNAGTTGSPVRTTGLTRAQVNGLNWLAWAALLAPSRIRYAGVTATGGMTTAQILANHLAAAQAADADLIAVLGGRNDVAQSIGFATTVANLKAMYTGLLSAGKVPIICTTTPITGGSTAQLLATDKLVQWEREFAARNRLPLADLHAACVNPLTGEWVTGFNTDISHPGVAGVRAMGTALAQALQAWLPPAAVMAADSQVAAGQSTNAIVNALNLTDAGPDGIPDGFAKVSGTGETSTLPTPSGGDVTAGMLGKWWQVTRASGTDTVAYDGPSMTVTAGDRVLFAFEVVATLEAGAASLQAALVSSDAATVVAGLAGWTADIASPGILAFEATVPAGLTSLKPRVSLSAGPGTIKLGRLTAINLTTAGALS